jgi:RNA polymerase sigma-70 factor (ECF subfamily)
VIVADADEAAQTFEPHRRRLTGLAYRMIGSLADAEDVVQDAYLRWHALDRRKVADPRAYLSKVVVRLCLDHLKSARVRRESYVGPWLPDPIIDDPAFAPDARGELADDLSVALLMTLERLSPLERAAFLLHDVFDMNFDAIAGVLERSAPACRQLAARARAHVQDSRPRFSASNTDVSRLADAFHGAMLSGDVALLTQFLAEDAIFYSDGGGKRPAALHPIYGRDKIIRFFTGIIEKRGVPPPQSVRRVEINGLPGFLMVDAEGKVETLALAMHEDRIAAIYAVRNPDKLVHLQRLV